MTLWFLLKGEEKFLKDQEQTVRPTMKVVEKLPILFL